MLQRVEGVVSKYRSITKKSVQIELIGSGNFIELTVSEPWVISRNDSIVVVGEPDPKSGKFIGYAYKNISKGVFGKFDARYAHGVLFILGGLFFFWGIFPLFTHVPAGIRMCALSKKVDRSVLML